jgi:dTMP kinase
MQQGFLICLTGADGSGKTTHARALVKYLREKGYSCKYIWGASRPVVSYVFFLSTRLLGFWKKTKKDRYTDPLELAPRNLANRLSLLWRLLLFVDFQIRTFFRIRLPLLLGKIVVCDRYFYDLLMDLSVAGLSSERFALILSSNLPKPSIAFLLDAPQDILSKRRGYSAEELAAKRTAFVRLGNMFDLITINSSLNYLENQNAIRNLVLARVGVCEPDESSNGL